MDSISDYIDKKVSKLQSGGMQLITMAHIGEAQSMIEVFDLKKITNDLYRNDEFTLLITGEGPIEALTKTALTIPTLPISTIINIGIAGTLSEDVKVGDVVAVRTVYLVQELKPQFKTFHSFDKGLDCITSFERILDPCKARVLRGIGHLVDREAWGVAMAAKSAGIPFRSFKLISDVAGSLDACELIRGKAKELGDRIVSVCREHLNLKNTTSIENDIPGFHFTFTSRHRFQNLLQKLALKNGLSSEQAFSALSLQDFLSLDISSKEKTKRLIEHLEDQLDPTKKIISIKLQALSRRFESCGFKLHSDPQLENPKVTISFEAGSDEELKARACALNDLSIQEFTSLIRGEFNVE